ncbi:hypothetical protein [Microvirga sp. Mcv34]|uniref:hypothetical protein n=1 Tax=Microvirga sp. Mcv34 TaxID=2926016 RepID=UPI0021C8F892|nr:hypothetical protein [Microvirga sp. Mcv34]
MNLRDDQRVEIALPARLIFGVAVCNCFGPDPEAPDQEEAKREVAERTERLVRLLQRANVEPFEDLHDKGRRKVAARIDRVAEAVAADFDQQPAVSIALSLFYFLQDLLDRGVLELNEGSSFAEAMTEIFIPAMEGGLRAAATLPDDEERIDRAAQRRAAKLLKRLQGMGYYRYAAPVAAAAVHFR